MDSSRSNRNTARLKSPLRHWNGPAPARLGAGAFKISLVGREDHKLDSRRRDRRERVFIGSTLRQPHPDRLAPETENEIVDTPYNLQLAIARRQQRQNRMAVRLRDRVAMAAVRSPQTTRRRASSRDTQSCHASAAIPRASARRRSLETRSYCERERPAPASCAHERWPCSIRSESARSSSETAPRHARG